jgi:hypothetical protein
LGIGFTGRCSIPERLVSLDRDAVFTDLDVANELEWVKIAGTAETECVIPTLLPVTCVTNG